MGSTATIGFIGLGVMGGPMCRNITQRHDGPVLVLDRDPAAIAALGDLRCRPVTAVGEIAAAADIIFLSLPGGAEVEAVCCGQDAIEAAGRKGQIVVDLSTTQVSLTRRVAARLAAMGVAFADAPVARTREAAQRGELSIMVGAEPEIFERILPLLHFIGSDVSLCGSIGCGQVVKLINNTLVFGHTVALAEMMVVAERAGVTPQTLLDAVSKGSGDSFVLRNHGMKAMLPRRFPERAFPPEYVLKDIDYMLELAGDTGVHPRLAGLVRRYYEAARARGLSGRYFPGVIEFIDQGGLGEDQAPE